MAEKWGLEKVLIPVRFGRLSSRSRYGMRSHPDQVATCPVLRDSKVSYFWPGDLGVFAPPGKFPAVYLETRTSWHHKFLHKTLVFLYTYPVSQSPLHLGNVLGQNFFFAPGARAPFELAISNPPFGRHPWIHEASHLI